MNKTKAFYKDPMAYYEMAYFLKNYINDNTIIVCIGTDRCIGDCLGPLTGTILKNRNFPLPVYGTISEPIHALNLNKKLDSIKLLYPKSEIIGIDACLGNSNSIGEIQIRDYPIHPGKGVGKSLPDVGTSSIIGIVDSCDSTELFTNRNIRLNLILDMTTVICDALMHSYYLFKKPHSKNT
ncbi:putative sporulation protein YyaC [Clostridium pasteurianum DSM 525 = ATCC 6013]|uniref:Sporulation protein YyaC n=1 Tax=Clostridium pasteurianum DSM 525 = ATCC 6013 TaxID=1262449 RepID=A0A0H3JBE9_CLOPA|nr:spore protease YyaC [Clostridium pasteurianum]AJA49610.1 putative sporulation protein YyaC [Clostridium pasteurianum DSM 525 = ATCC 6013]AJA53598.1 putative sporulation protein YyaC [Clostridium pasteurianum DSM 525 = ATCC 6013]AOZ76764.1 sporulation protein [Clostridium pasteurianum DSM 525 = ATCC 6013]AOZ80561.1 sporulation protein [Clostridium pasteurianum]ELP58874.1 Spore protease GPR related protein [Clostridium pasteurianum DSM 525 = ATCC 6013]